MANEAKSLDAPELVDPIPGVLDEILPGVVAPEFARRGTGSKRENKKAA